MIPLSVSTVVFDGHPLMDALTILAEMGVRRVEPAYIAGYVDFDEDSFGPPEAVRLRRRAEQLDVGLPTLSAHCDLGRPDAVQMLERRIDFAAALGVRVLITNVAQRQHLAGVRHTIEAILPVLERAGLTLALENPGHGRSEIVGTATELGEFVRSFASPVLRANLDLCNIHTYSGGRADAGSALDACRDVLASLHLKEVRSSTGGWDFCEIGGGEAIRPSLLAQLGRLDPSIAIGIELPLRLSRPSRGQPVRAVLPVPIEQCRTAIATSIKAVHTLSDRSLRAIGG